MRRLAVVVALVLSGTAGAAVAAIPAQALPHCPAGYQCDMVFYSNSAHTSIVGGYTYFCDGEYTEWGVRSGFPSFGTAKCQTPVQTG